MIDGLLTAETALSELPGDSSIWMVCDPAKNSIISLREPTKEHNVTWIFLKREDADHFLFLLNKLSPQFKDSELRVEDRVLQDFLRAAVDGQHHFVFIPPNSALEFFKEFEQFLPQYYGL